MRRLLCLATLALAVPAAPALANDWPNARHDPQRTGRSDGHANLATPTVRWRHYLGGALRGDQAIFSDIDGDRVTDVVYVAAGKVYAKHADDTIVWESALFDAQSILGPSDLDNDGHPEVVALAAHGGLRILDGRNGSVLWELPRALRGEVSSARAADLDGDGHEDLYIGECLFGVTPALAYTFHDGFGSARQLWQLPQAPGATCGTSLDVIGDVDGDGAPEVVLVSDSVAMPVLDARTGRIKGTISAPPSGQFSPNTTAWLRNLDGDPALELVLITNGYVNGTQPTGARRVAVFDHVTTPSPGWRLLWEDNATDRTGGNVAFEPDAIADLDGDGVTDIAYALYDPTTRTWTMTVRRAATGVLEAQSPASQLIGVADIQRDGHPVLLTQDAAGVLNAVAFEHGALVPRWSIPSVAPVHRTDLAAQLRAPGATHTLLMQLDDSPPLEFLAIPFDPSLPPESRLATAVSAYRLDSSGRPQVLGTFTADAATTVLTVQSGSGLSRPYDQPVVVTSDGYLESLDRAMRPTNRLVGAEFTIPGMRVGGYFAGSGPTGHTPVIGTLGGERAVVVRDSRPVLLRLDARVASAASPPVVRWQRPRAAWPLIADVDGDGASEVIAIDGRDVLAIDPADGQHTRWAAIAAGGPPGSAIFGDVLPARHPGDRGLDVVLSRVDPGGSLRPVSLHGTDGSVRWNGFTRTYHSGYGGFAVADLTNDGVDDMFTAADSELVIDGATGTPAHDAPGLAYGFPTLAAFTTGAPLEALLQCSYAPDLLFNTTLSVSRTAARPTYPYGALVQCDDGPGFVGGALGVADLWSVRPDALPASGAPGAAFERAHAVLADGAVYPTTMVVPPEAHVGVLSSVTAIDDLDGAGHPAVLVGGTDGWLYALDPCSLALRWSMSFRAPVGEAVVGDADGDGIDDVLVTTGDGYLSALGPQGYPPPAYVWDTDPPGGHPDSDVSEIETFDTLYASWAAVPGATSYEVGAFTAGGTALQYPDHVTVPGTTASLSNLPIVLGGRYRFGVIAVGPAGTSREASSAGVTVVDRAPPEITVAATPSAFAPSAGQHTVLGVVTTDRTGLAHAHAEIRRMDNAVLRVIDDNDFHPSQPARTIRYSWNGADGANVPLPLGLYLVVATATDVAGHVTTQSGTVSIVASPPDAGLTASATDGGNGCGCRAAGDHGRGPGDLATLTGVGLTVFSRRRRRARTP